MYRKKNDGFSINNESRQNINEFFFGKSEPTNLDLYKSFTRDKDELIEKIINFVDLVYSAINE